MSQLIAPQAYHSVLDLRQTELAIKFVKDFFESGLSSELKLRRVTAPLFVLQGMGINDDLNGVERPVSFRIKDMQEATAEVVHSLAKWKRLTLADYHIESGHGIYTDMNAIRADEELDNTHSLYVDQWDWEMVIEREQRNLAFLKQVVKRIYATLQRTEYALSEHYPLLKPRLPNEIFFIHSEELRAMYPNKTPKQRENLIAQEHGAVFVMGIGGALSDGEKHDGRAPDYDDWTTPNEDGFMGLNGDILVWDTVLEQALELSSMGIRVDEVSLPLQLETTGQQARMQYYYHKRLMQGSLPLTLGGGIGQSRLCMFLLQKAHVGEIQASIWPEDMRKACQQLGIHLL